MALCGTVSVIIIYNEPPYDFAGMGGASCPRDRMGWIILLQQHCGERMPRDRRVWAAFFGMGLLNNAIPFSLIVWGQQHIAPGVASILSASTPLFTVVLAHLLTSDERMTDGKFARVLIGFVGVAMMIGSDALRDLGGISSRSSCALPVQSPGQAH